MRRPSELIQVRPATESVRSVPSASIRTVSTPPCTRPAPPAAAPARARRRPGRPGRGTSPRRRTPRTRPGPSRRRRRRRRSGYWVNTQRFRLGGLRIGSRARSTIACRRGIDPGHRAGVGLGGDPDPAVDRLRLVQAHRRQVGQLRVGRVLDEVLGQARQLEPDQGMRPAQHHRAIAGLDQRPGLQLRARSRSSRRRDPQAVVDQQVRPAGHHVFGHVRACVPMGSRPGRGERTSPRIHVIAAPWVPATHHPGVWTVRADKFKVRVASARSNLRECRLGGARPPRRIRRRRSEAMHETILQSDRPDAAGPAPPPGRGRAGDASPSRSRR